MAAAVRDDRIDRAAPPAYTAAKGGVLAMSRSLAVEHAPEGIRVNCRLTRCARRPHDTG